MTKKKIDKTENLTEVKEEVLNESADNAASNADKETKKKPLTASKWFKSDDSPVNFFGNCITRCKKTQDGILLNYKFAAPEFVNTAFDINYTSIKISSTSLRTAPDPICGFIAESMEIPTLTIYGYIPDTDDEHLSRLDYEHMSRVFNYDTINKFTTVKISGSFKSIEDMKKVLNLLYDNLIGDKIYGKVVLYASSLVNDENGKARTIADLVDNGYRLDEGCYGFMLDYGIFGKKYYTKILKGSLPDEPIGKLDLSMIDADK